jgi:hypothetical protein
VIAKGNVVVAMTGQVQRQVIGDVAQLGGAMVIRPEGAVVWSHMSADASDSAPIDGIVAAVARA